MHRFCPVGKRGACGRALVVAMSLAWTATLAQAPATAPWQVLILNGADPNLPAFAAVDRATRSALTAPTAHPVDLYSETLDATRLPDAELESETLALLARTYPDRRIDAVIAVAPAALDFAEKHRDRLWPSARIVYHSVPAESLRKRSLRPTTTGVPIRPELAGTVALALQLRPETTRVVVISGAGDIDRAMTGLARTSLEPFGRRVQVDYWVDRSIDELAAQTAKLPSDAIVLYLAVHRDAAGRMLAPRDALQRLAAVSPVPFFGVLESDLGAGIAAGRVDSYELRGRRAAELVTAALASPGDVRTMPVPGPATAKCIADATALARHDIDEDRLPQGCEVRFRQLSLWRSWRWQLIAAAVAAACTLLGLLFMRRRRDAVSAPHA